MDRSIGRVGITSLGQQVILAAEILAGRRVGIGRAADIHVLRPRNPRATPDQTQPIHPDQAARCGATDQPGRHPVPRGPDPGPAASIESRHHLVVRQKVALGRTHQHQTVAVDVTETTLVIQLDDQETRVVRRTTTMPVINIKSTRPRSGPLVS